MDSSSSWLNAANDTSTTNSDYDNDGNDSNCPLIEKTQPPTMASAGNEMKMKRRMDEYDNNSPQSLPFLSESNLDVAEIIIKEESRAKRNSSTGSTWHYDEVVTFFRGLYVYGKCHGCFQIQFQIDEFYLFSPVMQKVGMNGNAYPN